MYKRQWGFLNVMEPYYKGGEYEFLLNSDRQLDLLGKRFIVFELDNIRDNKVLLPIVTITSYSSRKYTSYIENEHRLFKKNSLIVQCFGSCLLYTS